VEEIMPRLSINERTKIVEFWHQSKSVKQVQRLFGGHFGVHMWYWRYWKFWRRM